MNLGPQMTDISVKPRKGSMLNIGPYGDTLENQNFEILSLHVTKDQHIGLVLMNLGHQTADDRMNNQRANSNTGSYGTPIKKKEKKRRKKMI